MRGLIAAGEVAACHDLADGGLLVALAEMVLASGIGADLELPPDCDAGWLFGEDQGRYLLAVAPDRLEALLESARREGVLARRVGTTGGRRVDARWRRCHMLGRARPGSRALAAGADGGARRGALRKWTPSDGDDRRRDREA